MKGSVLKRTASFFAFYCILFIPFPFHIIRIQQKLVNAVFGHPVYSDSGRMYLLVLFLFILSLISALIFRQRKLQNFIYTFSCYYLSLILMKYGLDKVFLKQFYLPEPNTLFTPVGQMEKELLYWSAMGVSPFYSFFMGSMEVITAVLLLFKRTRLPALILALGILINIAAINFGFDISVKLFSLFLLFLCCFLLLPWLRPLYDFFTRRPVSSAVQAPEMERKGFAGMFLKWTATGLIVLEGLYPFIKSGNFNDSLAKRPFMHGAYEITEVRSGNDSIPLVLSPVRRFFIHRKGYMIFEDRNDRMKDYLLTIKDSIIFLTDYQSRTIEVPFHYNGQDSLLKLHYPSQGNVFELTGKAIDWRKLPVLKKGFHWISE